MNKTGKILRLFLFIFTLTSLDLNASSISMFVDENEISSEDSLRLTVKVNGKRTSNKPMLKNISNFEIQGSSESSQYSIINGSVSSSVSHIYTLFPKKSGEFIIGPAVIKIDGQEISSNQITVKVSKQFQSQDSQKSYFIEQSINKKSSFVSQKLIYTFKLYSRAQMVNATPNFPDFKNFYKEMLGKEKNYQVNKNGMLWNVSEVNFLLIPNSSGRITLPEVTMTAQVLVRSRRPRRSDFGFFGDSFFTQRKNVRLKSQKIELEVKELPLTGRPEDFSGLVGSFNVETEIDKNILKRGESLTLSINISGDGNVSDAILPKFNVNDFKVYDDKPQISKKSLEDQSKLFKMAIVPQVEGTMTIPELLINYFNPQSGTYEKLKTKSFSIQVNPAASGDEKLNLTQNQSNISNLKKQKIEVLAKDLSSNKYSLNKSFFEDKNTFIYNIVLVAFSLLVFLLSFFVKRKKIKLESDESYLTRKNAFKKFKTTIKKVSLDKNFPENVSTTFKSYLGEKYDIDGLALTSSDLDRVLSTKNINGDILTDSKKMISDLEKFQFSGMSLETSDKKTLIKSLNELVSRYEKN